ncbi:hypothetical protein V5O48_015824 [Marasmius crinis-equi]|uniref:Uncharacterized protein n=1 Tax=Marasmius crinis-equi TaxID=585013 RepID=A0ABR3ETI1_9AGAR
MTAFAHVRFTFSGIEEPIPIVFPTPQLPPTPPKDPFKKPSSKQTSEKPSLTRVRDRAKTLSNTPPSTLVKLLLHEEFTTKKTRELLTKAVDQLSTASQRATDAEASRRALEVQALLEQAKRDQEVVHAREEAIRARTEVDLYRQQLKQAQDEAVRTQEKMKSLRERQVETERNAAQARSLARKYRGQTLMMAAKERGKMEGYREGLRMGREVIGAKYALEYDYASRDGGSAFIEPIEDTDASHSTPRSQPRKRASKSKSRKQAHAPQQRDVASASSSTPRAEPQPVQQNESPQLPAPLPLTPPQFTAQQLSPSPPVALPIPPPQPSSHSNHGSERSPAIQATSPIPSRSHSQYSASPNQPEIINIREPAYAASPHSQQRSQSNYSHSPAHSSASQPLQTFPQPSPSQGTTNTVSPLGEDDSLRILEYVPMPAPPAKPKPPVIQAPVPAAGVQNSEADRQREVDVSTPSTMTGIAGLRTFPSYVPTASSSGGGADVGGRAPSASGSVGGGGHRPGSRSGSVRSNGSGEQQWPVIPGRRGNLSTIYEQSREGTPGLTPMHTGTSVQSQERVNEWRKSLSESSPSETKPLSPMHSGSSFYAPPPSVVSQDTLNSSFQTTDLRRRGSSSSARTASIHIEVEPPSRTPSDGHRTPVPGGSSNHGYSAPPYPTSGNPAYTRFAPPPQQQPQPGYLSPNRSPLDLAPIQSTEPGPTEPPVIPGQIPAPRGGRGSSTTPVNGFRSGVSAGPAAPPHIYATGQFPAGFMPQVSTPRNVPIARPLSPADSDEEEEEEEEEEEDESTTSSRRNLFSKLDGGGRASDVPPGAVSGGTPQVSWKTNSNGGGYESWPPNPPPIGSGSGGQNPLPKPPQAVSGLGSGSSWGGSTYVAPTPTPSGSPHVARGGGGGGGAAPVPIPIPNSSWGSGGVPKKPTTTTSTSSGTPRIGGVTPKPFGTPRVGFGAFSPSLVSSLERSLPPSSPRRSSMHAGTTPILKPSSIRDDDDDEDEFDTQTNENTRANSARTVRMGRSVKVGVAGGSGGGGGLGGGGGGSPYRAPGGVPLYR